MRMLLALFVLLLLLFLIGGIAVSKLLLLGILAVLVVALFTHPWRRY